MASSVRAAPQAASSSRLWELLDLLHKNSQIISSSQHCSHNMLSGETAIHSKIKAAREKQSYAGAGLTLFHEDARLDAEQSPGRGADAWTRKAPMREQGVMWSSRRGVGRREKKRERNRMFFLLIRGSYG
jgi:hypothetical protein